MPRRIQGFGWIPDHPDRRDLMYAAPRLTLRSLPPWVDLRPACPPVYDQRALGSCTANVVAAALQFDQARQRRPFQFTPSRLFVYYNARFLEGTVAVDSGAMIRDAVKGVAAWGACPEPMWGYEPAALGARPSVPCYRIAAWHRAVRYERVAPDLLQMKGCLASGYPFALGFTVYESFLTPEVAATGHAPLPSAAEAVAGSHAVLAVGYDDAHRWFILRNSWGDRWGMAGYFTLPYAYLTQSSLADDFWTIRWVQ